MERDEDIGAGPQETAQARTPNAAGPARDPTREGIRWVLEYAREHPWHAVGAALALGALLAGPAPAARVVGAAGGAVRRRRRAYRRGRNLPVPVDSDANVRQETPAASGPADRGEQSAAGGAGTAGGTVPLTSTDAERAAGVR